MGREGLDIIGSREMHELSITQSILSIALGEAKAAEARKIVRVNVVIGELTNIVDDCVRFYFELLSRDTIASEATLSFERPPTQLRCRDCGLVFCPDGLGWKCSRCGNAGVEIISGRECRVSSIEVD